MPIPLNRLVAFVGPYISVVAGGLATWLIAKLNALGIPGLDKNDLAQQLASALTFTLVAVVTWLGSAQWLDGHHVELAADAELQAATLAAATSVELEVPPDPAHDDLIAVGEDLPSDEEEFASAPSTGRDARAIA